MHLNGKQEMLVNQLDVLFSSQLKGLVGGGEGDARKGTRKELSVVGCAMRGAQEGTLRLPSSSSAQSWKAGILCFTEPHKSQPHHNSASPSLGFGELSEAVLTMKSLCVSWLGCADSRL